MLNGVAARRSHRGPDTGTILHRVTPLYSRALPATRSGALFGAFSYPTKISPETIALFIATHTEPGATVLDPFAGSGTTGLGTLLCSNPSPELRARAQQLNLRPAWGPRSAVLYEIGALGAFVSRVLSRPPDAEFFRQQALRWIERGERRIGHFYRAVDDRGRSGILRHAIWTEFLVCPGCGSEASLWDAVVRLAPVGIASHWTCPTCGQFGSTLEAPRAIETVWDPILQRAVSCRKRRLARIYGRTGSQTWARAPLETDDAVLRRAAEFPIPGSVPRREIPWGDLHRAGYHHGITHVHHFYTARNLVVMGLLWETISDFPPEVQDGLRLLALSYNAMHSTLMTRVVAKNRLTDFGVTGAQSGVLYISGLPVEKNILFGLKRKTATLAQAFRIVGECRGEVVVVNDSSTSLALPDESIDYVFTDPPFGDFIPYAEVNFLNEAWLGRLTDTAEEAIASRSQGKDDVAYAELMARIFREMARVLKPHGTATVAFHAARVEIWEALRGAYDGAGFRVELSSVLDKLQGSFKQVTSAAAVRGDPLFLLAKGVSGFGDAETPPTVAVIDRLVARARRSDDPREQALERLYSRFVGYYLERGVPVPLDAGEFYTVASTRLAQA